MSVRLGCKAGGIWQHEEDAWKDPRLCGATLQVRKESPRDHPRVVGYNCHGTDSIAGVHRQCPTAPSVRPYSNDFAIQLSVYGKRLSSQPASVYHGGLWLYLLHRPEPPYACRDYRPSRLRLPRRTLTLPANAPSGYSVGNTVAGMPLHSELRSKVQDYIYAAS